MAQSKRATIAGVLIGIGMGGFVDGILLHQILQWHNMVSNWVPPNDMEAMKTNMLWDGIFHAFMWLVTLAGILLFWRAAYELAFSAARRSGPKISRGPKSRSAVLRVACPWAQFEVSGNAASVQKVIAT